MIIRKVAIAAFFSILFAANNVAFAAGEGAAQFVDTFGNQTIEIQRAPGLIDSQRSVKFRNLLSRGFDIPFIGRFVIGRSLRRATPEQRREYIALFSEFFLTTQVARLGEHKDRTFAVTGVRVANAKDFIVSSTISSPDGQAINADWRVRKIKGRYRIIDIMVEGISMAIIQRSEFAAVVKRGGLDKLLVILHAKTEKFSTIAAINQP